MNAKLSIIFKSFEIKNSPFVVAKGPRKADSLRSLPIIDGQQTEHDQQIHTLWLRSYLRSIRLPKKRTLYTVLRSPHIDKKSREQFEMKIHKQCYVIKTETKFLRTQLLRLKLQDIPGVQCKIVVNYKTRLNLIN